jgi:hypothetical protein
LAWAKQPGGFFSLAAGVNALDKIKRRRCDVAVYNTISVS